MLGSYQAGDFTSTPEQVFLLNSGQGDHMRRQETGDAGLLSTKGLKSRVFAF